MTTLSGCFGQAGGHVGSAEYPVNRALPALAAGDVRAPVIYAQSGGPRPRVLSSALTGSTPEYHGRFVAQTVPIFDVREGVQWLSLDREGFEFHEDAAPAVDLYDDDALEAHYYPQVRRLIARATGASRVIVFDHTRRIARESVPLEAGWRAPARHAHNDYTPKSLGEKLEDVLRTLAPHEAGALRERPVVQINHWRPITGPVLRMPLALIDAETLDQADLIETDLVYPDRVGEIYHIAANPEHRWLYVSRMQPHEVWLIKGYDSRQDGRARLAPHGAFEHSDTPVGAPPRESIEVRTLAFI